VLSSTPECTKTHLRASAFSKIFRGYTPGPPLRGGEGRERAGEGWGEEGEGRELSRFGPTELWSPYDSTVTGGYSIAEFLIRKSANFSGLSMLKTKLGHLKFQTNIISNPINSVFTDV
jgi:hypothetical protein